MIDDRLLALLTSSETLRIMQSFSVNYHVAMVLVTDLYLVNAAQLGVASSGQWQRRNQGYVC